MARDVNNDDNDDNDRDIICSKYKRPQYADEFTVDLLPLNLNNFFARRLKLTALDYIKYNDKLDVNRRLKFCFQLRKLISKFNRLQREWRTVKLLAKEKNRYRPCL